MGTESGAGRWTGPDDRVLSRRRGRGASDVAMSSRVLLTGSAGFIGSHLAEALLQRGHAVTGVDNFDPFYARDVKERNLAALRKLSGFRFIEADVARDP